MITAKYGDIRLGGSPAEVLADMCEIIHTVWNIYPEEASILVNVIVKRKSEKPRDE